MSRESPSLSKTAFPYRGAGDPPGGKLKDANPPPIAEKGVADLSLRDPKKVPSAWDGNLLFTPRQSHRSFMTSDRQKTLRVNRKLNWFEKVIKRLTRKIAHHSAKTAPPFGRRSHAAPASHVETKRVS